MKLLLSNIRKITSATLLLVVLVTSTWFMACQRENDLFIDKKGQIRFTVSGYGALTRLKVSGPDVEREANRQGDEGNYLPSLKVYWELIPSEGAANRSLDDVGVITYGKLPEGFIQVFPVQGSPSPLVENDLYNVQLWTNSGRGVNMFFSERQGKIVAEGQK